MQKYKQETRDTESLINFHYVERGSVNIVRNFCFVFHRRQKFTQVWNNVNVRIVIFGVDYPVLLWVENYSSF